MSPEITDPQCPQDDPQDEKPPSIDPQQDPVHAPIPLQQAVMSLQINDSQCPGQAAIEDEELDAHEPIALQDGQQGELTAPQEVPSIQATKTPTTPTQE